MSSGFNELIDALVWTIRFEPPQEVVDAMMREPERAVIHADRWMLLGLLPGEYRVDDTCTLRMVPR